MPLADAGGTESAEEELGAAVKRQRALEPAGDVRIVPTGGTGPEAPNPSREPTEREVCGQLPGAARVPEWDDV